MVLKDLFRLAENKKTTVELRKGTPGEESSITIAYAPVYFLYAYKEYNNRTVTGWNVGSHNDKPSLIVYISRE